MIDINKIRNNPEEVKQALLKRMDKVSFDELLAWDKEIRVVQQQIEKLRSERNQFSDNIAILKRKKQDAEAKTLMQKVNEVNDEIATLTEKYNDLDKKIFNFMSELPNIPDPEVVAGGKENNKVIKTYLTKPNFDFKPKTHMELATDLKLIDYERGVKLAGPGSWIYNNLGARLEWALLNYFIDSHIADNWKFELVPHMLKYECGFTAGQFPKFLDEVYWLDSTVGAGGKFILPTAETALINLHMNEVLSAEELPKKYFGYTPCYRREAGSTRVEERGTVRGHQFNKVEMVQFTEEGKSETAFDEMVEKAERLIQGLGLHYQVSALAAKDCSAGMCKTYDIEVWIPSMGIYKEVSSVSNSRDYQARRGNMKYKVPNEKKPKYLHTLNASGLATSRLFPAILEQCQQKDGSVLIPKVLQKYIGMDKITPDKEN